MYNAVDLYFCETIHYVNLIKDYICSVAAIPFLGPY